MGLRRIACCLSILALGLACASARAELWGYVDGAGVMHVAARQIDSRYSPLMGNASAGTPRVPGKRDSLGALVTWLEIAPEVRVLQPVLREAAAAHGVDVELLKALIAVESGFDPKAVSPKGAVGLMQMMPATADRYATKAEVQRPAAERLLDPRINIHTGARMLADLKRRLGRVDLVLAAWNAGEGSVQRHGGAMPPFAETQAHVHMVLELYWALLQRSLPRHQLRLHDTP
jgi:soluble lytic murein transglycosylase-like protein